MARKRNSPHDVFKYIDMHDGDPEPCWTWTGSLGGTDKRPYFAVSGTRRLAYRIVYELVHGVELKSTEVVRHKCDTPHCCNPAHLETGTHAENMQDMKERERHGLPHNTIRAIKALLTDGRFTHAEIAERYGVSRQLITEISRGTVYSHVETDGSNA